MAASYQQAYTMNASVQRIGDLINSSDFAVWCKLVLRSVNPTANGVWFQFHNGANFRSWGENVTITLSVAGPDSTFVTIHSECSVPTQVVDWGKNKEHVDQIHYFLLNHLSNAQFQQPNYQQPQYQQYQYQQPQYQQYQQPVQQPVCQESEQQPAPAQETPRFCVMCGCPVTPGSSFCTNCGAKLQ